MPLVPLITALFLLTAIGCTESAASPTETAIPAIATPSLSTVPEAAESLIDPGGIRAVGFTHIRSDGNRYATGKGDLPNTAPDVIPSGTKLAWVVGTAFMDEVTWVIVNSDGSVRGIAFSAWKQSGTCATHTSG